MVLLVTAMESLTAASRAWSAQLAHTAIAGGPSVTLIGVPSCVTDYIATRPPIVFGLCSLLVHFLEQNFSLVPL